MFVRMVVDNDLVTGNWHETTAPDGEFKGSIYTGTFQLLVETDGSRMDGLWVGNGQEDGKKHIYSGRWEFVRAN